MRKFLAVAAALMAAKAGAATYDLPATPQTVAWGHYDATAKPVLTVKSGDTVVVHTLLTNSPTGLAKAGVPAADIQQSLRAVFDGVPQADRGPGGHILTGPIAIEGAEPGDTLEVRILKIDLAIPYAYNGFRYGVGFLTDDFPYSRVKIVPLDAKRMVGHFAPGIDVPLHPFFGSMGVAPPASFGRYDSTAPTISGGNMDDKALVAGTSVFFPVYAPGALLEVGDGHAAQGNGEVDITALETSLTGTLQLILHKGMKSSYPRAETPSAYISMGFDDDLSSATRKALTNMIDFLVNEKRMSRDDAYMLISVAGDVEETELVDRNKGVHVVLQKALFTKK
jgi:acetamidase/formamidase